MLIVEIPLTKSKVALVDAADYAALTAHKWYCNKGYAVRSIRDGNRNRFLYMHRVLLNPPDGLYIDHINGNKLDNRRSNLRLATKAQNAHNTGLRKSNTSGFKGVTYVATKKRWLAQITTGCRNHYLGIYSTPEEAHAAYCVAASVQHGEFARTA